MIKIITLFENTTYTCTNVFFSHKWPPPQKKKNYIITIQSRPCADPEIFCGLGRGQKGGGVRIPPTPSRFAHDVEHIHISFGFSLLFQLMIMNKIQLLKFKKIYFRVQQLLLFIYFFYFLATLDRYIISSFPGRACTSWLSESSMHVYTSYIVERIFLHCPYVLICFLFDLPIFYVYYDFRM